LPVIPPLAGTNAGGSNAEIREVSSAPATPVPQEPIISPQMLIQYFRPSTNAQVAVPSEPVGFLQPLPPGVSAPAPPPVRPTNP